MDQIQRKKKWRVAFKLYRVKRINQGGREKKEK
jgi:hypothetical protein